ncbi:MAG: collagen-like protein [Pseudobutyrivibrio ruminis]|nr:collagen-like protein [Pseudobutyrivibrio ruminis]
MLSAKKVLALSKKYTEDVTKGIELIQGKPCTIKSIEAIGGGKRITYQWTADDGTTKTQTMDVMDGEKGDKGDPGNQGVQGVPGPRGANGTAATIRIGSVTSGESPSVTNSGTSQDAILNFILAKGDKGDKGEKGNDGQNGSSFSIRSRFATYEELIAAFPTGPENEGDAYFVGTTASPDLYIWLVQEQEWYNNGPIAGVKGDKGDQGDEGFSPVANVTKDSNISTITVRDKTGTTTAQVKDGYSPTMSVSKSGDVITVEVTDESGTTEEILDLSGKVNTTDVGTAAYENTTEYVSPLESDLPTSRAVYRAMSSAVYGAYHPSGSKSVSELTSDLLVQANVGNVYKITNSGVTTDLFIEGAGITINAGDNAVVVYASENTFKFDLQSGVVDLSGYQEKELPSGAMIEDIIPTSATSSNKLVTESGLGDYTTDLTLQSSASPNDNFKIEYTSEPNAKFVEIDFAWGWYNGQFVTARLVISSGGKYTFEAKHSTTDTSNVSISVYLDVTNHAVYIDASPYMACTVRKTKFISNFSRTSDIPSTATQITPSLLVSQSDLALSKVRGLNTGNWISTSFDDAVPSDNSSMQIFTVLNSATNTPATGANYIVITQAFNESYIQQEAIQNGTNNRYIRYYDGSSWSSWEKLVTESNAIFSKQNVVGKAMRKYATVDGSNEFTNNVGRSFNGGWAVVTNPTISKQWPVDGVTDGKYLYATWDAWLDFFADVTNDHLYMRVKYDGSTVTNGWRLIF